MCIWHVIEFQNIESNLPSFSKPAMNRFLSLAIVVLSSLSCTDDQFLLVQEVASEVVDISLDDPTRLQVVNELEEDFYSINTVEFEHYAFEKLNVPQGKSKEFLLTGVLPANLDGIEITVTFSSDTRTIVETGVIDLYPGGTTVIWLTGREGCGGCGGHSIEWGWED